jgi:magnesium chelatase subunit D
MTGSAAHCSDAMTAAVLFAIDPAGMGGVWLRSAAGPVRDLWLEQLRFALPIQAPWRKLPPAIADGRLLGGIDLAATLQAGRPVIERGLMAEVDGGILVAAMAERITSGTAARLSAALDCRELVVERDGVSLRSPSSFGVVALDEGVADERVPAALCDRLAFHIDLAYVQAKELVSLALDVDRIVAARRSVGRVAMTEEAIEALCSAAASLGVTSLRAPLLAARVARAAAALEGEEVVQCPHLEIAARLVLAPRATSIPSSDAEAEPPVNSGSDEADKPDAEDTPLEDIVLEAARAAIPIDLLRGLMDSGPDRRRGRSTGAQASSRVGQLRGRPVGVRRGELRAGARLSVLETLRAAAPWQPLRRKTRPKAQNRTSRLIICKDDFRVTRFKEMTATSTIFVVDASGSSALQRLAEVKGAVELLLADCYVRRDEVALIAFRGHAAELILPPTRSLTRARRGLAALPGGGGTPLSAAIISATALALGVRSKGRQPTVVLMTDGRANICRDGTASRASAEAEAQEAARQLRLAGIVAVVIDTSPRPQPQAERIAAEMHARYVALPYADAARLSRAVQANI